MSLLCSFAASLILYVLALHQEMKPDQLKTGEGVELLLLLGFGSYLALSLAAWTQIRYADDRSESLDVRWDAVYHQLPYLALTLVLALLLWATRFTWDSPTGGVVAGVALVAGLVMARQLWVLRQNVRLEAETVARRGETRFRSMVQNSADVIAVVGADGSLRYSTPSIEALTGPCRATLSTRSFIPTTWKRRRPDGSRCWSGRGVACGCSSGCAAAGRSGGT